MKPPSLNPSRTLTSWHLSDLHIFALNLPHSGLTFEFKPTQWGLLNFRSKLRVLRVKLHCNRNPTYQIKILEQDADLRDFERWDLWIFMSFWAQKPESKFLIFRIQAQHILKKIYTKFQAKIGVSFQAADFTSPQGLFFPTVYRCNKVNTLSVWS